MELLKGKEQSNVKPADSIKTEIPVVQLDPPSGIPNTLLIRKSKRKFFVTSTNAIYKNEDGDIISVDSESNPTDLQFSSVPKSVSIPSTSSNPHIVSTRKYSFHVI